MRHRQEGNQFDEDDAEFSDLDRRSVHAAAGCASGALCLEDLLAGDKKAAPLLEPRFKEVKVWQVWSG